MGNTKSRIESLVKKSLRKEKCALSLNSNGKVKLFQKSHKNQRIKVKRFSSTLQKLLLLSIFREFNRNRKDFDGENDRRKILTVDESSEWLFCTIGKIKGFCNGKEFYGTGTLIGPNVVLTCAHNVFDLESKTEHVNLKFFPASNGGNYKDSSKVVKFHFPEEYRKYNHEDKDQFLHDYALLFPEKNFDDYYGYLGLKNSTEDVNKLQVSMYGYSGCTKGDKGKNLVGMEGPVNLEGSMYHYDRIDTYYGQSGSGLFKKEGGEYLIAGVHVGVSGHSNQAVKINAKRLLQIKTWTVIETHSMTLDLSSKEIGAEGMKYLSSMNLPQLQTLDLSSNQIGAEGIKYLSSINLSLLQTLDLSSNVMRAEGINIFHQ